MLRKEWIWWQDSHPVWSMEMTTMTKHLLMSGRDQICRWAIRSLLAMCFIISGGTFQLAIICWLAICADHHTGWLFYTVYLKTVIWAMCRSSYHIPTILPPCHSSFTLLHPAGGQDDEVLLWNIVERFSWRKQWKATEWYATGPLHPFSRSLAWRQNLV